MLHLSQSCGRNTDVDARVEADVKWREACRAFLEFARLQVVACSFAFTLILCLALTRVVRVPGVPRYDLILVLCLVVQGLLVRKGLETWADVRVIAIFHLVGVLLEWSKVQAGAWSYPEFSYLKLYGVPLYSGFMYAAVASYMMAAWRLFDLEFRRWPNPWWVWTVMVVVYGQFFAPIQILAVRFLALGLLLAVFGRCWVAFRVKDRVLAMPAMVAFMLIGFFVWIAENVATYFHAWTYPYQRAAWQPVHISKVLSWTMLMVVSLTVIQTYKGIVVRRSATRAGASV